MPDRTWEDVQEGMRQACEHDDETIRCHNNTDDCRRVLSKKEYDEMEDEADRQVAS